MTPKAAHGIFDQLNWKLEPELAGKETRFSLAEAEWGKLPDGHVVGKPTPLFPRIEIDNDDPARSDETLPRFLRPPFLPSARSQVTLFTNQDD